MKITQATVKTIYDIEIDFGDFLKAFVHYGSPEGEIDRIMCPKAFEGYDLKNHTSGYIHLVMEKIGVFGNGDTAAFLARFFEFDGWCNAGHYHKPSGNYRMTVYNYGDRAGNYISFN